MYVESRFVRMPQRLWSSYQLFQQWLPTNEKLKNSAVFWSMNQVCQQVFSIQEDSEEVGSALML